MIKLTTIKPNPNNPRAIRDARFAALKKSLDEFPDMMEARPIVVDEDWMVLGGNMRLAALQALGFEMVSNKWVKQVKGWTPERKREFTIKDNASFGEWDWEKLANEWDDLPLNDWGIDIPLIGSDETIATEDSAGTVRVESIKFRSYQIVMTETEADSLEAYILGYMETNHALPGLVGELLSHT